MVFLTLLFDYTDLRRASQRYDFYEQRTQKQERQGEGAFAADEQEAVSTANKCTPAYDVGEEEINSMSECVEWLKLTSVVEDWYEAVGQL